MKCSTCGASMWWAKTAAGKPIPIDALPSSTGNMVVHAGVARVLKKDEQVPEGTQRWTTHFATCPQSREHRRG